MTDNAGYELVPLTEQEIADLSEARAIYLSGMAQGVDDGQRIRAVNAFVLLQIQILIAHGFDPMGAAISQPADGVLTMTALRIKEFAK